MQFNDVSTNLGICQEIDALCDSTSTSYPVSAKTRRVNAALEEVVGKIIAADGTWQFDDTNFTDLPIGTQNLVNGQQDYSFDEAFLTMERIEVMDQNGIWYLLKPLDKSNIDIALNEYRKTAGFPLEYDKNGSSIFLYPPPATGSVTLTAGLRVYFKRTASLFTASDTTKEPGIASPFHILLAYKAALPYCMTYKKDRVVAFQNEIARIERDMMAFYGRREQDVRKQMTSKRIYFR